MANLSESSVYESGIYQLETTDPVLGGASGIANTQAKQLANRTKWIYDQLASAGLTGEATEFSGDLNTLRLPGFYLVRGSHSNAPLSGLGHLVVTGRLTVSELADAPGACQLFLSQQANQTYFRFLAGSTWTSWFALYRTDAATTFQQQFAGMVAHFPTATAPDGWLAANGAAVSRTVYAALFARCGTTFGAGNGSTTFNLPDLRGEFIRGFDDGRGVDPGRTLGSAQALSTALPTHTHIQQYPSLTTRYITDLGAGNGVPVSYVSPSPGAATTTGTGDSATETRPRNVALLACIKY